MPKPYSPRTDALPFSKQFCALLLQPHIVFLSCRLLPMHTFMSAHVMFFLLVLALSLIADATNWGYLGLLGATWGYLKANPTKTLFISALYATSPTCPYNLTQLQRDVTAIK